MNKEITAIAPQAMNQLLQHAWPGNVRELEHAVQRAVALCNGSTLTQFDFAPSPEHPRTDNSSDPAITGPSITIPIGTTVDQATRQLVEATIDHCHGNKLKAARVLGMAPRTMYRHFADTPAGEDAQSADEN
jgi:two-component system response regulator HydG